MTRIKRGYVARKRRNYILGLTSGFRHAHSKLFRPANQQAIKALRYAYRDRIIKKRDFRKLWIIRINAIAHKFNISYSTLINKLKKSNVLLNRKILAQIAILDSDSFLAILNNLKSETSTFCTHDAKKIPLDYNTEIKEN